MPHGRCTDVCVLLLMLELAGCLTLKPATPLVVRAPLRQDKAPLTAGQNHAVHLYRAQVPNASRAIPFLALGASLLCIPQLAWPAGLPLVESSQPVLHRHARPVEDFDEELAEVSQEMLRVMYKNGGIGLAAPQVGIDQSVLVYNILGPLRMAATERILVNPRVVGSSRWSWTSPEGCLSLPDARGLVTRPLEVEVEAFTVDGRPLRETFKGVEARVVLHEVDHLNGVLFTESGWTVGNTM